MTGRGSGAADLVIAGGRVVFADGVRPADVAVTDGRIAALTLPGRAPAAARRIEADGLHVLPGLVDAHVHVREPGLTHKEDWASATAAAAAGGVTTLFDMPNTVPPTDTAARLRDKLATAGAKARVDFGVYGLLAEHNLDELAAIAEAGAVGFKLFLGETTGGLAPPSDGAVLEGFARIARTGKRIAVHAENAGVLAFRTAALKAAGRTDPAAHEAARPDVAAVEALCRACLFAEAAGARLHVVHESTAESLPFIRLFKERGLDLTVEVLPAHLLLTSAALDGPAGTIARMNPPLRDARHHGPLWAALRSGLIDTLGSDHAPHAPEEKRGKTIWDAACGFAGVETALPLMLTAVNDGRLDLVSYVRAASANPARAFGLYPRKGAVAVGSDADLVLVDLDASGRIAAASLHGKNNATPFEGFAVRGLPVMTLVRGRVVAEHGEVVGEPGGGRPVEPAMPPRPSASGLRLP